MNNKRFKTFLILLAILLTVQLSESDTEVKTHSKAVSKGAVKVGSSIVSSQSVTVRTPSAFDVTSTSSRHSVSTICQ